MEEVDLVALERRMHETESKQIAWYTAVGIAILAVLVGLGAACAVIFPSIYLF